MKTNGCALPLTGFVFMILGSIVSVSTNNDSWLGFVFIVTGFVIIGLFFILGGRERNRLEAEKKKDLIDKLNSQSDYTPTQKFVSLDNKFILSLDEVSKRITITSAAENKIFLYKDILQSEIIEDGVTVTKTSRGSQLGGALIGGVLLGGAGAIIGGLSGNTTTENKNKDIKLKIVVNDTENPVYYIVFKNETDFVDSEDPYTDPDYLKPDYPYLNSIKKANYWHSLISVLIKKADDEDKEKERESRKSSSQETAQSNHSVADELLKLSELLKQGIITQDEFDTHKQKILSK